MKYTDADEPLRLIKALRRASVIAVVSSSVVFLQVARSLFAPAMGSRHELREIHLGTEDPATARAADIVFCDSIAYKKLRLKNAIHYGLVAQDSIAYVRAALQKIPSF